MDSQKQIAALKRSRNALILAHYYQPMEVQEVADVVGDSFEMARRAAQTEADVLVVCGVRFMAESAKLLSPEKTVLLPAPDAGCPMADMITPEEVAALRLRYPDAAVMCYVNSSAAVKAACDICCTSSSAVRVARSLPERRIIFVPDKNLGAYVAGQVPEKEFILFEGYCPVHHELREADVLALRAEHPDAVLLVHPECRPEVVRNADVVGSTSMILEHALRTDAAAYLIGTEMGVVERIRALAPGKNVWPAGPGMSCMTCADMKKTTLKDVVCALETLTPAVELPERGAEAAARTLLRMVEVSA